MIFNFLFVLSPFYFLLIEFQGTFFHLRYSKNILCLLLLYSPPGAIGWIIGVG